MQVTARACGWMFESMYTATSNGSRRPACWRRAAGQAPAGGNWTSTSPRGSSSRCCDGSQFSCKLPTIDAIIACRFRLERKCRQNMEAMKNPRCLGPSRVPQSMVLPQLQPLAAGAAARRCPATAAATVAGADAAASGASTGARPCAACAARSAAMAMCMSMA